MAGALSAQTTNYPGALDNDLSLFVTSDSVMTYLTAPMGTSDSYASVASSSGWVAGMLATVCDAQSGVNGTTICSSWENMLVTSVAAGRLNVNRGAGGTTVAAHAIGRNVLALIDSAHQASLKAAVLAIETELGANLSHVQAPITAYSTISGLSGYPSTFPPVNSGNWAGTWQGNAPSAFEPALGNPGTGGYCLQSTTLGVRSWGPCGSGGGASSQGSANNLNVSDGAGGFLATPLSVDHTTGAISGPSTAPMLIQGVHQSASGLTTPATNQDALVFDSANSDHLTRKDSAGALHDIEASGGGSSGWPVGSTPSLSPATGTYSSTQSATASCSHGTAYYCLGALGSACASGATVTAYSTAVSVATSARFQAQCRDGGYDPGAIGYSDITISAPTNLLTSPTDITNSAWTATDSTKTSALVWTTGASGSPSLYQTVTIPKNTTYTTSATLQLTSAGSSTFTLILYTMGMGTIISASHTLTYGDAPYTFSFTTVATGTPVNIYYWISTESGYNLPVALSGMSLQ